MSGLGIVVLAHRDAPQVAELLWTLEHPAVRLYLHVDSAADFAPFRAAIAERGVHDVRLLPRFRSRWGGIEIVDATLAGLARAVEDGCDHVVLVSGQDVRTWPVERIVTFFADAPGRSWIRSFPLPDARWRYDGRLRTDFYTFTVRGRRETCIPPGEPHGLNWKGRALNALLRARTALLPARRFPSYASAHGGSQWWNLSRDAARYVLRFVERHPDYRRYHEHTLLPDEIFFQSILLGTGYADEHEVVNDDLRFMIWPEGASHPRALGPDDVPSMLAGGKPFARKVDAETLDAVNAALAAARATSGGRDERWRDGD